MLPLNYGSTIVPFLLFVCKEYFPQIDTNRDQQDYQPVLYRCSKNNKSHQAFIPHKNLPESFQAMRNQAQNSASVKGPERKQIIYRQNPGKHSQYRKSSNEYQRDCAAYWSGQDTQQRSAVSHFSGFHHDATNAYANTSERSSQ